MLETQLNVLSPSGPSKQFLPESALGAGFGEGAAPSTFRRDLVGDTGLAVGSLHTLTWRTPVLADVSTTNNNKIYDNTYVTNDWPTQLMSRTKDVHLLAEWSLADPFLMLTAQINKNPSFTFPKVARYCESGLKARLRTPKVWSFKIDRGISDRASLAVEKIKTRGLYPV